VIRYAVVVAALAGLLASGCALDPYAEETLPPVESHAVRITEGTGTTEDYHSSVEVTAPAEVQYLTEIADGKAIEFRIPQGPATELEGEVFVEGETEPRFSTILSSADGEPLTARRFFEYDPGYIGVEEGTDDGYLTLRVATPRLTGTGQGQVPFTFKLEIG
jgi:hypothetical protein